ncbi:MAG: hypothetical protein RR327_08300 [Clostridia bacterium]
MAKAKIEIMLMKKERIMDEQMSLEEYKKKVEECLLERYKSATRAKNLVLQYEDDIQELMSWNCTPQQASGIIASGLY